MSRLIVVLLLAAVGLIAASTWQPAAGRELTEREMWITFGGLTGNDMKCVAIPDCLENPAYDCNSDTAEEHQAHCENTRHHVDGGETEMEECSPVFMMWHCEESAPPPALCRMVLRCQWDEEEGCSVMPFPLGWVDDTHAPVTCTHQYVGP